MLPMAAKVNVQLLYLSDAVTYSGTLPHIETRVFQLSRVSIMFQNGTD